MFIDEAEIYLKAGSGGNGAVSFLHQKFLAKGGPDGGDGGDGGDIIFEVDNNIHGLIEFRRSRRFLAENGQNGRSGNCKGKSGRDLILKLPLGTQILKNNSILADLVSLNDRITLLKGGRGGWGNQHFATSIKQAPQWSKRGECGESMKVGLVLKTIADIGLVGLPNSGKSSLLAVLSSAKPKIADYPFTTLEPNLGLYRNGQNRLIIADIPGLIEGASQGRGLGHKFLRHIERTKIIVHLVQAISDDPWRDYRIIRRELENFSKELAEKPEIVLLNKIDLISAEEVRSKLRFLTKQGLKPLGVSAATHQGINELVRNLLLTRE